MVGQCHPSVITDSFTTYACHGYNSPSNRLESHHSVACFMTSFCPTLIWPKQGKPKPHRLSCNFQLLSLWNTMALQAVALYLLCTSLKPAGTQGAREMVLLVSLTVQNKQLPSFKFHTHPPYCKLTPSVWMDPCYLTPSFIPSNTCLPPFPFIHTCVFS